MRNVATGKKDRKKEKIMLFLVAINVVPVNCLNSDRLKRRPLVLMEISNGAYLDASRVCFEANQGCWISEIKLFC